MQEVIPSCVEAARTEANSESVTDALKYISDSLHCFHLFQGHRVRVVNQQIALASIDETLRQEAIQRTSDNPPLVRVVKQNIDWKMKFNEKRLRESQLHHFGQRGHSWHECVSTDYIADAEGEIEKFKISLDQILATGNKQDGPAVLSKMETMLQKFDSELDMIQQIILFSDNAACYHSKELLFFIPVLNALQKRVSIAKFVHAETQDGKGNCDAHGAVAERHVDFNFIRTREESTENKFCATSKTLATAISCKGGIQNNGESRSKETVI